ncbi:MAG: hypothetical protein AAF677_11310 [Pseudomonadota bacterium]
MRLILGLAVMLGAVAVALSAGSALWDDLARWALVQQRLFQNEMAGAIQALRGGEPGAWAALLGAAGAYGFVHAVGPGHGKYLIGGVGLGSAVSAQRLVGVALLSSLAQALWAILLVYGGFFLLEATAAQMTSLAEEYLAPASYMAIGAIGGALAVRGARALWQRTVPAVALAGGGHAHADGHGHGHGRGRGQWHGHDAPCGCHAHGPSPEDVARLCTVRDTAAMIVGIAMRPCTGALFLLVIAWQMGIALAGAVAALVMGLGVAAMTALVAVSSVAARGVAHASSDRLGVIAVAAPSLQLMAGLSVIWFSLALLRFGGV